MIDDVAVVDRLTRCPDPGELHAPLLERGPHELPDGRWVVASAADVRTVLAAPQAPVGFTADRDDPVSALQSRMARFTDGPEHAERRAAVCRLLDRIDPAALRSAAAARTRDEIGAATGPSGDVRLDVMARIARQVPVTVLAEALGVDAPERAAAAIADLAPALAPPLGATPDRATALAAVHELGRLLPEAGIAILFQAHDATAGLIGNACRADTENADTESADTRIAGTLRHDAPVQLTTRHTAADLPIGDRTVPRDRRVVVVLAAAGEPFGVGSHACPGATHATALAAGVLDALGAAGLTVVEPDPAYEPRLNLRIPTRLTSVPSGSPRPAG